MFIASYDYGYGNELVPYLKELNSTVLASVILGFILIWILYLGISALKNEHVRVYTSVGYLALACLVITGLFGYTFWDASIASIVLIGGIVIGIELCILGDTLDEYQRMLDERNEKWSLDEIIFLIHFIMIYLTIAGGLVLIILAATSVLSFSILWVMLIYAMLVFIQIGFLILFSRPDE